MKFVEVQPNDGFGIILPLESLTLDIIFKATKAKEYSFDLTCRTEINRCVNGWTAGKLKSECHWAPTVNPVQKLNPCLPWGGEDEHLRRVGILQLQELLSACWYLRLFFPPVLKFILVLHPSSSPSTFSALLLFQHNY